MSQITTESVRINKELLEKIKYISKSKGQTITGYINFNISKQVDKDWVKFSKTSNAAKSNV